MSVAQTLTKMIIGGVISFASLFNPSIESKTPPANTIPTILFQEIKVLVATSTKQDSMNKKPKNRENNTNRKLNLATIPKSQTIQVGLPILPLKDILNLHTVTQVNKNKIIISGNKSIFDIVNTIPTIGTRPLEPNKDPITRIQNSLANIFCKTQSGNTISAMTGSAVIINPLGVALTNAHVAEYPLIEKYFKGNKGKTMNCYGRIGSPASGVYKIDVLYISPDWVKKNSHNLVDSTFRETGEDDIAIVRFVSTNNRPLTYTNISNANLNPSAKVYVSSYPALELKDKGINANLYGRYEENVIRQIDTYSSSKPIFETGESALGQAGSSGGGVFDTQGDLVGIIGLIVQNSSADNPYIRGLTIEHIRKTLAGFGTTLDQYTENNPDIIENDFSKTATELESILIQTLSSSR